MRWSEIINETTTAGCIAVAPANMKNVGSDTVGVGMDTNQTWRGIYPNKKKKPKNEETVLLRR